MTGSTSIVEASSQILQALTPWSRQHSWDDPERLKATIAAPSMLGYVTIGLFGAGLFGWGAFAPLAGGAIAPGVISPDGSKKSIQHLEGGIVEDIRVRDGDVVQAGAPLVVLASVLPRASFDMAQSQHRSLLAKLARLEAERIDATQITLTAELTSAEAEIVSLVEAQQRILETHLARYSARKQVLLQRIEQLNEQIKGHAAQVNSARQQLLLIAEELESKTQLLKRGYLAKPEALRLQRAAAEISGRRGEQESQIARSMQQIGEARIELLALDAERADQIATDMEKTRNEIASSMEKLRANQDVLQRTVITSPVDGVVVNLKIKTRGGVVQRGDTLMEIVPNAEKLIIEARVSPLDIDIVHGGLDAKVMFASYSSRTAPQIHGTVRSVSADRLFDPNSQRPYYLAKVEIDRQELMTKAPKIKLVPGMPADVLVVAEERTLLQYLLQPLRDALRRGLREA